jgi:LAO/AO transport system kinase
VVLVPEAGDEIQTMKAGLMEIADIFVVNKSDRPDADQFVKNLRQLLAPAYSRQTHEIPIIKTIASEKKGISELTEQIIQQGSHQSTEKKTFLLARKAWHILLRMRMKGIDPRKLEQLIADESGKEDFNLFRLVEEINKKY